MDWYSGTSSHRPSLYAFRARDCTRNGRDECDLVVLLEASAARLSANTIQSTWYG
jgi:hypothetical protein